LTADLAEGALKLIEEVENMGGMAQAIAAGVPKMRIEQAAAARQARIDAGFELITGLNNTEEQVPDFDLLEVDNTAVRQAQLARLEQLRAERDSRAVSSALDALTKCAETGKGNLLEYAVAAARARATLGEISAAMEKVFGRYTATVRTFSGVYSGAMKNHPDLEQARKLSDTFAEKEGRR